MSEKVRKLSEEPNAIEMYKQNGYILSEETKEYLLFREKYKLIHHILLTALFYWVGIFTMGVMTLGMLMFIGYPIMCHYNRIKVMKNE
ncbi:MAG: hypothetical protein EOL97_14545 [Spirochaetia bacterium]|nr:hypothetical protein [Spirochaetia bacterium]